MADGGNWVLIEGMGYGFRGGVYACVDNVAGKSQGYEKVQGGGGRVNLNCLNQISAMVILI